MSTPAKTFLFGTGCQKGGTTWVHNHLTKSPEYARGYRKEYHVFDSQLPSEARIKRKALEQAQGALAAALRGEKANGRLIHRASMVVDPVLYYNFFTDLLNRQPHYRAAADLTPDYALLSADTFRTVQAAFAKRGVRTVAAFLMRDPVDRVYSHMRMQIDLEPERFSYAPEVVLERHHTEEVYALRTRYQDTIATLDEAFAPEDRFIGFYEELFVGDHVRAITDMLGMQHVAPDVVTRRNQSSPLASPIPEALARQVAEHYADTYVAVAARFPDKDLRTLWPHSRHVLG